MDEKNILNKDIENGWHIIHSEIHRTTGVFLLFNKLDKSGYPMEIKQEDVNKLITLIGNAGKWEKYKELKKELK